MDISLRIKYIEEIASKLSIKQWAHIDLVLRQFGLPITDIWNSQDREAYVIGMIQDSSDDKIINLAKHLGLLDETTDLANIDLPIWKPRRFRLFVSHLSSDGEFAQQLQKELDQYYISAFVAHVDIKPTKEWLEEIVLALNSAHALVALMADAFHESEWTDQEIGVAVGRDILIVPVKYQLDPYGFIGKYQALKGENKAPDVLAQEIFQILLEHKLSSRRMIEAVVSMFEESYSFQNAKNNIGKLEQAQYFDEELAKRIRAAVNANGQISGSWNVPERVDRLIKRFNINLPPLPIEEPSVESNEEPAF